MKLYPEDTEVILYETGFDKDLLGRGGLSKQLSELIEKIESPIVFALDDKWGSGKTFFLKRWVGAHQIENQGTATTVYFDAFENDYMADPLVSLISAVSERISKSADGTLQRMKRAGSKLVRPAFNIALSLATFGAQQHVGEIGDAVVEAVSGEAEKASKNLWAAEEERKNAVVEFKELLTELVEQENSSIVIVVDEGTDVTINFLSSKSAAV